MFDAELLGEGLAEIVREEVVFATRALTEEVAALRRQLADRPPVLSADAIKAMIDQAVAAIPAPAEVDLQPILNTIDATAREAAQEAAAFAIETAIAELPAPHDGDPGKDADPELIREMVAAAVAELPVPKDGKDIDPDAIDLMIAQAVAKLPTPKDGTSVTADDVAPLIEVAVQKAVAAIPVAKDGVGLAGAMIGRDGSLVVTLTDGSQRDLGCVVGRDGIDAKGEPGRDALQLSDFDTELSEDGRILTLRLENEEIKVTHELQLPTMIYRGVHKEGQTYVQGDTVTWAGSLYHCNAETSEKPGEGSPAWTLAAKRGSNGKDAR
jgi:hypothetical protein